MKLYTELATGEFEICGWIKVIENTLLAFKELTVLLRKQRRNCKNN